MKKSFLIILLSMFAAIGMIYGATSAFSYADPAKITCVSESIDTNLIATDNVLITSDRTIPGLDISRQLDCFNTGINADGTYNFRSDLLGIKMNSVGIGTEIGPAFIYNRNPVRSFAILLTTLNHPISNAAINNKLEEKSNQNREPAIMLLIGTCLMAMGSASRKKKFTSLDASALSRTNNTSLLSDTCN